MNPRLNSLVRGIRRRVRKVCGLSDGSVTPARFYPRYRSLRPAVAPAGDYEEGRLVFVLPPVARGSGGMADVFHLGTALEQAGSCRVEYFPAGAQAWDEAVANIRWNNPGIRKEQIRREWGAAPEYLCATAWWTAYESLRLPARHQLYFVQDYEPWFHPAGVERHFAEHTYRLGLEMITLGPWLADRLSSRIPSARVSSIPFPMSDAPRNTGISPRRDKIAFYIQPDKPQRGSELLIESARLLSAARRDKEKDCEVVLFGSRINEFISFEFPCTVHGVLTEEQLADLMSTARLGVSTSFTNISLVPFRFLAFGCPVVELDLPNVRMNVPAHVEDCFHFVRPDAESVVKGILDALERTPVGEGLLPGVARLHETNSWRSCAGVFAARMKRVAHNRSDGK